jgi:hypothetical protein
MRSGDKIGPSDIASGLSFPEIISERSDDLTVCRHARDRVRLDVRLCMLKVPTMRT